MLEKRASGNNKIHKKTRLLKSPLVNNVNFRVLNRSDKLPTMGAPMVQPKYRKAVNWTASPRVKLETLTK